MILETYADDEVEKALDMLKPDAKKVLILHYRENLPFSKISELMKRSMTVIRNHHNRGIYKLYRHFNPRSSETS